ncbi:hypothetical protein BYT27DRAFT_7214814 [Phlegmacium glaucopus]|nr:hypothetical protein BYT27DRAFT_7214814 [Phlegmacium glaucopus]
MPLVIPPGPYNIVTATAPIENDVPPGLYLTNNGTGEQLTVENVTGKANQEWYITMTKDNDAHYAITPEPPYSGGVPGLAEDVPTNPDQVFLLIKLQVWVFNPLPGTKDIYEIIPFHDDRVGAEHLLGVDENRKVIIRNFPIVPGDSKKPAWQLFLLKKD